MMKTLLCIHPGSTLLEDFMKPYGLSPAAVAQDLCVSASEIGDIIEGKKSITGSLALRFAKYFGTSAQIWMRLQARYDLEVAQEKLGQQIELSVKAYRPVPLRQAA